MSEITFGPLKSPDQIIQELRVENERLIKLYEGYKVNLRDQFAMAALTGLLRESIDVNGKNGVEIKEITEMKTILECKAAYRYAGIMLEVRKENKS